MIRFPRVLDSVAGETLRAGGTDLADRRHLGVHHGDLVDLRDVGGLDTVQVLPEGVRIGARVTIQALADHAEIQAGFPALAQAAAGLATPQIRSFATVGGNLMQRTRCNHFRAVDMRCLKLGGDRCVAETGDHVWHAIFSTGACWAVHPSTLAVAFLCFDAAAEVQGGWPRTVPMLYGTAQHADREHDLSSHEALSSVWLPGTSAGQKSTWLRAAARERAEWPLVEVVVRRGPGGAVVAAGGIAPVPMRLAGVEAALQAGQSDSVAAERAADNATPLPGNAYKTRLLINTVRIALERTA